MSDRQVVRPALVGFADQLPRRVDRDHALDRVDSRGPIRVIFLGEPAIGGLDDLVLRLGIDLEDLVRIRTDDHRAHASAAAPSGGSASGVTTDLGCSRMKATATSGLEGGSSSRWNR